MKAVQRAPLEDRHKKYLVRRAAKLQSQGDTLKASDSAWKSARKTKKVQEMLDSLVAMNGNSKRCMYCEHNEGTDIDHFCPRSQDPSLTFAWANWLFACSACNSNHKREQYPFGLLDPTKPGYEFHRHFSVEKDTGRLAPNTSEAVTSEPVFGLNRDFLQESRRDAFPIYEELIIGYAKARPDPDQTRAVRLKQAILRLPHRTIFETIKNWYQGHGRRLLFSECASAIDRYPEILSW